MKLSKSQKLNIRDKFISNFSEHIIGPQDGETEFVKGELSNKYLCGMLFPRNVSRDSTNLDDDADNLERTEDDKSSEFSLSDAYESLPSSIGISVFLTVAKRIQINTYAAKYNKEISETGEVGWRRTPLASQCAPESIEIDLSSVKDGKTIELEVFDGDASIQCFARPFRGGRIITITMLNNQSSDKSAHDPSAIPKYLFQAGFSVDILSSIIDEYPSAPLGFRHEEDEELDFIYSSKKTYAIGHGCSATWMKNEKQNVTRITAEYIPIIEVPSLTTKIHNLSSKALEAQNLKKLGDPTLKQKELADLFFAFINEYEVWHEKQKLASGSRIAKRITDRQSEAIMRMREGVNFLVDPINSEHFEAFKISQQAMLKQFVWNNSSKSGPFSLGTASAPVDSFQAIKNDKNEYFWRPFQLAFQLLTIESLGNDDSNWKDLVDLLWFPTGGGKTEAYLALVGYEIAKRRLLFGASGGGTSVWMRYTLRLLTSQQFERCTTLISVLEEMRRNDPSILGNEPISLGLWVGSATTPNRLAAAGESTESALDQYREVKNADKPENKFQLTKCPKCGTRIIPEKQSGNEHYGVEVTDTMFRLFCPDAACSLHAGIPVSIVDDDLYVHPPTFLLGTIDKFARTVHETGAKNFFGLKPIYQEGSPIRVLPPTLIIQDELHLIDGPLGTIAGVYEAGFDTIFKDLGITVKYLAATATILRAKEQIKALYGRDGRIFPPTGISVEDSFFSREDDTSIGRTYVGVMNSGLYKSTTTLVQASAAGLQATKSLGALLSHELPEEEIFDSYWTQVIYHNSRQELGKTTTLLRDDVDARLGVLQPDKRERRGIDIVKELSANLKRGEIREALDAVEKNYDSGEAIDVLPCTNMLSVGVDIGRLGQMIVKGQPKSTAEYIQATSRVGRDNDRPPGVVITLFSSTRPRDRSHYETFISYHQALYRNVEPSTVTPFSPKALDRTLHAALVFILRCKFDWENPEDAQAFSKTLVGLDKTILQFKKRLKQAIQRELSHDFKIIEERLNDLLEIWHDAALNQPNLKFKKLKQFPGLLTDDQDYSSYPNLPWPVLNSMRHVDGETNLNVQGD